jgi:hypothetical protein
MRLPRFPILPLGIQMYAPDGLKSGAASNRGRGLVKDRKNRLPDHRRLLLRCLREARRETELLHNGKCVRHDEGCEITDSLLTLDLSPGFILIYNMSEAVHIGKAAEVAGISVDTIRFLSKAWTHQGCGS